MQIHPITPSSDIITMCSYMLNNIYGDSDYTTRQNGNDLIDDDRSQFIGYLGEIIDIALYELYNVETDLYEIGQATDHFAKFKSVRIIKDYIQFCGYIDTSDTNCNVEVGKVRTHSFTNTIYEIETIHIQDQQWQVSFKIPLDKLSEFMYELEAEMD